MTEPNRWINKDIIRDLDLARFRNRSDDNPNMRRPRMVFDFESGKVRIEDKATC